MHDHPARRLALLQRLGHVYTEPAFPRSATVYPRSDPVLVIREVDRQTDCVYEQSEKFADFV